MAMKVLVACEESQAVTIEFRKLGHEAYSCDILPCSGGHPEWHLQQDVLPLLGEQWDMVLAFPPCTHLASSGSSTFPAKRADGRQAAAAAFFMRFVHCRCEHTAIENPAGAMSTLYRRPDQYIQPWQFGESFSKRTGLWLYGLPLLVPTQIVQPGARYRDGGGRWRNTWHDSLGWSPSRARLRSQTFPGIARAMAEQWGRS